ncbi:MAG: DUF262 domain-containing protein [Atopobiaceae bacterium]
MDAGCRKVLGLISEMNVRFVVPVYQRPYSWGKQQCVQLWNDILHSGNDRDLPHFTGSIVTIQDGSLSEEGVAPLLLIDGQQRITTITLILMALARYSARHPEADLPFSHDEIVLSGYLTNHFRTGDDHYKLTMSKGDHDTYRRMVDAVEDPTLPMSRLGQEGVSERLLQNLQLFDNLVESQKDPGVVWAGLQRLEVVSIELAQGRDRPQLIFESMNSTGKDLSCADLVRNFVLMDYPLPQQPEAYRLYWEPIERTLGALGTDSYDQTFEDFLRCYLTAACAPRSFAHGDAYQAFKEYIVSHRYNQNNRMRNFSLRLRSFAEYYAMLCLGRSTDRELGRALGRIENLGVRSVRPLVLQLMDMQDRHALSRAQLLDILATLEAYLVRRSACECDRSVLPKFFSSLVARLDAVFEREDSYYDAFNAMLRNEDGGPCRMPDDQEFGRALRTRDAFYWRDCAVVLGRLEDDEVAKKDAPAGDLLPADFDASGMTVEHVMPVGANRTPAWADALAADPAAYARTVNLLGNLALTWGGFDLQMATPRQKAQRLLMGREGRRASALSAELARRQSWSPELVQRRSDQLAEEACGLWPVPAADGGLRRQYSPRHRDQRGGASFRDLFDAGLVRAGDVLVSANPTYPGTATVIFDGSIMLAGGQHCDDPQQAYEAMLEGLGAQMPETNGWLGWRRGEGGPLLDELREALQ